MTTPRLAGPAALLALALALSASSAARAEPTKEQCLDAYKKNQQLRREGSFREAIKLLILCARNPCPEVLQPDCVEWLRDANARIPSIVVRARSGSDPDVTDVTVTFDGVPLLARLDGRAVDVDPGEHTMSFARGAQSIEKKILLVEGEKGRVVDVDFPHTPPPPRPNDAARPVPWAVYALGGLGVAALGFGATFGTIGLVGRGDLTTCTGSRCLADKDAVARKFLVADISFAVGAVSLVAAAVLYLTRPSSPVQPASAALLVRSPP